jgi:hypothetical protein
MIAADQVELVVAAVGEPGSLEFRRDSTGAILGIVHLSWRMEASVWDASGFALAAT